MFEVSWSSNPSFSPHLGEMIVDDATQLQCNITGLTPVSSVCCCFLVSTCILLL